MVYEKNNNKNYKIKLFYYMILDERRSYKADYIFIQKNIIINYRYKLPIFLLMSVSNIKKMEKKILVVFHDNDINSGASKSFLSNVLYLKKQNYSIDALIPKKKGDLKKELRKNGINIFCVSYGGAVYSTNKHLLNAFKSYLRCFLKLIISYISIYFFYSQNKHNNYTCIYSNTSTIYVGAWLSKLYRAKHIWHFREFGYEDQNSKRIFNLSRHIFDSI